MWGSDWTKLGVGVSRPTRFGVRAAIDFVGGAMSWRSISLKERMVRAIRKATIPILFIQAENDYDLGPSRTLAGELERLEKPHKLQIFSRYGDTHEEGHGVFCKRDGNVWGAEVFSFLEAAMGK
jgi:pimeloyl-ACP methyl ester carboxylesterase